MISCTEFIPAYNELFKFIEQKKGKEAVIRFWEYLSDTFLKDLRNHLVERGLEGCWIYWSKTLKEEGADFVMEIEPERGIFSITMHHCPSKGLLLGEDHIRPYRDYCEHCDVLYRRVLEPLGYRYELDRSQTDYARCHLKVSLKK